jgi:hypothetical protein
MGILHLLSRYVPFVLGWHAARLSAVPGMPYAHAVVSQWQSCFFQIIFLGMTTNERLNLGRYKDFHTEKTGVFRSPYRLVSALSVFLYLILFFFCSRGVIRNFIDFFGLRCLGICRPHKVNWLSQYPDKVKHSLGGFSSGKDPYHTV